MRKCDRCHAEGDVPYRIEKNDLCQLCWEDFKRFFAQFLEGKLKE